MNEKIKKFAMSKAHYLIAAWIVILGANTILMAVTFDCGYGNFSTFVSLVTPFLIILYGLLWVRGVKAEFEKWEKLKVADDAGQNWSAREWKK